MKIKKGSRVSKNVELRGDKDKRDMIKNALGENSLRQINHPQVSLGHTIQYNKDSAAFRSGQSDFDINYFPGQKTLRSPAKTAPKTKFLPFEDITPKPVKQKTAKKFPKKVS